MDNESRISESLERYERCAYQPGHFGDPEYRNVGYLTGEEGWEDRIILSNAYVNLRWNCRKLRGALIVANNTNKRRGERIKQLEEELTAATERYSQLFIQEETLCQGEAI